ncbi:MocR-like pyridoxine biosynthesis transcription factor PdxR [Nocardioides nematodiphilus]|uniref:MocR-like pyridoxine biosynthesis transcription factor PdxR n=1 Tax=Nocardioides nematodiphilus TaxID=2849669 RepID=UPI001CDA5189|nr:PLP-dependent aminotransferase family protein [Nocardioides nematodiphilus]MCA1982955.1 PLP-dependent aminotransferase family protein [Nocardioides nematodiphilus]
MAGADFLQLDASSAPAGGLATWLSAALRDAIADGRLEVEARLPATRVLAAQLEVSRGAVVEAYQRLTDEGLLSGRRGGGTVVRARPGPVPTPVPVAASRPDAIADLSPGVPDLSAFPRAAWGRAERSALAAATSADLGYGDPRGVPALRTALAAWLARTRGIRADPDDILIVNGVAQGLVLIARLLTDRGIDTVGFEDPGSAGARGHLQRWGLDPEPVPVDGEGLDVDRLVAKGLDAVVLTPAHQFPTGVVLSAERRRALADWAHGGPGALGGVGRLVIEDDYDAEHRYDRPPVAALKALMPERVIHLGSVSKTLAPAIRLGWLLAPRAIHDELVDARYWLDLASPALPQLTLAELLRSGAVERHLRLVRHRHRHRRDALVAALARHVPQGRVHGVAAGLHLLVTLPGEVDDIALAERAREAGVVVHPLSQHRQGDGPPGLVIGYAATPPDRLRDAVARLGRVIH